MASNIPQDLSYTKSHEWVRLDNGLAVVGITDHAQHELTDVVYVELPAPGRQIASGEACAVVESVKTASDIYSPLSGAIVEANAMLGGNPGLVNTDPYGAGWFMKIKPSQPLEIEGLLSAEAYGKLIQS